MNADPTLPVEHVLALPEPYRAAVLLRWFEAGFELEVSTSSGARSWQRVESLQLFAEDEDVAIPLWRKCVPAGWRGRVRLVSWSGEFDDVLTPRR